MRQYYRGLTAIWNRPYKENGIWRTSTGLIIKNPRRYFEGLRARTLGAMAERKRVYTYSEFYAWAKKNGLEIA